MSKRYLSVSLLIFSFSLSSCGRNENGPHTSGIKRLNNLVHELTSTKIRQAENLIVFSNPRDGWIFFTLKKADKNIRKMRLKTNLGNVTTLSLSGHECMRWLKAGEYTLQFTSESSAGKIVIRAIPELAFEHRPWQKDKTSDTGIFKFSTLEEHGRDGMYLYYSDYVNKNIMKNYNTVFGYASDELNLSRKKGIMRAGVKQKTESDLLKYWSRGFKQPLAGIVIDEFVPPVKKIKQADREQGGYTTGMGFRPEVFSAMKKLHANYPNNRNLYAYLGLPSAPDSIKNCRPLMKSLRELDYYWVLEAYLWPSRTIEDALINRMKELRRLYPGCEKNAMICLSTMEPWDNLPNHDMKVWLDMQMNALANHRSFKGIYGITSWSTKYTRPDLLTWFSSLMRHYCIEGNTTLLSKKYGYTLITDYLVNSDFSRDLEGWKIIPAATGSIEVRALDTFSFKKGYYPRSDQLLVMKRIAGKTNRIKTTIKNLQPGKFYYLQLDVNSPQVINKKVDYNLGVEIKGVRIINHEKRIIRNKLSNKLCRNSIGISFKALGTSAILSLSDSASQPAKPEIKEILIDFIKVSPLYSTKEE